MSQKKYAEKIFRFITCRQRILPSFLIIGGQRCGTTSLFSYLTQHPEIGLPFKKEVHYFDNNFNKSKCWYRSHFCLFGKKITGEASPYYLYHPLAPKRVRAFFPKIKLIVLLRNPVDRAYSHYQHEVKNGIEKGSFEAALKKEKNIIPEEEEKVKAGKVSFKHQHYSYVSRGLYAKQIKNWFKYFSRDDFLFLSSEEFYSNPQGVLDRVFSFLDLSSFRVLSFPCFNKIDYENMNNKIKKELIDYYKPYNQELFSLIKNTYDWRQ